MNSNRPTHSTRPVIRSGCLWQHMPQATQAFLGEIHFGTVRRFRIRRCIPWPGSACRCSTARRILNCGRVSSRCAGRIGPVTFASNRDVLFGCFTADSPADFVTFEARIQEAYARLLTLIDSEGYSHLLRMWNYFPGIGEREGSVDRYMAFCRGRYQALEAHTGSSIAGCRRECRGTATAVLSSTSSPAPCRDSIARTRVR